MPHPASGSPFRVGCVVLAMAAGSVPPLRAQPNPDELTRVQAYAEGYQRDAPSLVVEEHYEQNVTYTRGTPQHREMTSEMVMVRLPGSAGWMMLRDVIEVDKRPLPNREQRLFTLLQSPQRPHALQPATQRHHRRRRSGDVPVP